MIKLPIPNYYLIEVPMDAKKVKIFTFGIVARIEYETSKKYEGTNLPRGYYRLISDNIANITEEQADGIVDKEFDRYPDYRDDDIMGIYMLKTALQSLHSAFDFVGADTAKRYVLIEIM